MSPQRIQRKRSKGWRMPEGAIYVGRPTRWGNPFLWTSYPTIWTSPDGEPFAVTDADRRRKAVTAFEEAVRDDIGEITGWPRQVEIRRDLVGRDLACWCPLDQPCHADVLLRIANEATA